MAMVEVKRAGQIEMVPAGLILTGGTADLPGITDLAEELTELPARVGQTGETYGLVDQISGAAFATGLGAFAEQGEHGRFGLHAPGPTSLRADTDALLEALARNGVEHVYCLHPTFQWNLRFYSGERVTARWFDPSDRLPELPRAVDRALRDGKKVAIVGWARQIEWLQQRLERAGIPPVELRRAGHRLFWISDPSPALIRAAGFRASPS